MFIKYVNENDLAERGFEASNVTNLHPESFVKTQFNEDSGISTMMTVWIDSNIYYYIICNERESTIARGQFTKKEQLDSIIEEYFENDYVSYLERRNKKKYSKIEKLIIKRNMKPLPQNFFDISNSL